MKASGDTLLRLLKQIGPPEVETPRVLGVDDWAQRTGRTYGTILVDLERHDVVDLLPDRTATTLADWLRAHPGIEIVVRDRSTEYARGASEGAPNPLQVADRWHLLLNLRQVFERYLTQVYSRLKQLPPLRIATANEGETLAPRRILYARTGGERRTSQASQERRLVLYERVQELKREGKCILLLARQDHRVSCVLAEQNLFSLVVTCRAYVKHFVAARHQATASAPWPTKGRSRRWERLSSFRLRSTASRRCCEALPGAQKQSGGKL